eukprot:scaffold315664_cov28-Tisochrysis_lutea.AAC.3
MRKSLGEMRPKPASDIITLDTRYRNRKPAVESITLRARRPIFSPRRASTPSNKNWKPSRPGMGSALKTARLTCTRAEVLGKTATWRRDQGTQKGKEVGETARRIGDHRCQPRALDRARAQSAARVSGGACSKTTSHRRLHSATQTGAARKLGAGVGVYRDKGGKI